MKKQKSGEEDLINGEGGGTPEHADGGRDNAGFEGDGAEVER